MRHSRPTSHVQVAPSDFKNRSTLPRFLAAAVVVGLSMPITVSAQSANSTTQVSQNPNGGVTSQIVETADLAKSFAAASTTIVASTPAAATTAVRAKGTAASADPTAPTAAPTELGKDLARMLPTSTVVRAPKTTKKKVVKKVETTPAPASTIDVSPVMASSAEPKATASKDDLMEAALAGLRKCESGNRYNLNTGNGYYGAYQFSPRTWKGLGLPGLPHEATPAEQDAAARKLQAKAGWGQWPACSRKLGLR